MRLSPLLVIIEKALVLFGILITVTLPAVIVGTYAFIMCGKITFMMIELEMNMSRKKQNMMETRLEKLISTNQLFGYEKKEY